ncbi:Glycosyltransferase involved in cell wall bisynthesis [Alkalibacterium subtropicum]|uniref:Glycosyltransferase involved in cell wall bisynthesis n=1 Tax=Alkalibacterium subtropicum TaxID=753702 RepID=A0A1I1GGV5_9LACT|nr:glycosyltransferase family 4 protein [Alkalibacterium subtropicum]SFC10675.1 Glycosyltransferase involved in cell wall bisynthesis [Alkalibacterium subtropicum]
MNALFAHDHIFYKFDETFLSNGGLSYEVLSRYLGVFDNLQIISRQVEIDDVNKNLTLASGKNVKFCKVPNYKSIKKMYKVFRAKRVIREAVKGTDCVIARLPSLIGNLAIKYAKKYNKPYMVEVVGCAWDANINYGNLAGKILAPYDYLTNRFHIKHSKYTIYITKNFLQKRYPTNGKIEVCPNVNIKPVNSHVLFERLNRIIEKRSYLRFGLIGSLDVDYKGHETVIKALGLIKDKLPDFKVEFLGEGDQNRWRKLLENNNMTDNVFFVGTLPSGKSVYNWMDKIDIILQPSYAEAQGRSIIEAMSRGCPIISSKVGGIVELIDSDWLIEAGDYTSLSKKILNMVEDPQNQILQSKRNFQEARQYYKYNIEDKRSKFLTKFKIDIERMEGIK